MKRLGIVAVGLALVVTLAFGAGAFALYVWPGQERVPTPTPPASPRYLRDEAIAIVRAALTTEGECSTGPLRLGPWKPRWAAVFEPDRGSWLVAMFCDKDKTEAPPLDSVPANSDQWRLYEDRDEVVPLTDLALKLMQPKGG